MTQTTNRIMDEFAKLMNDAAGVAQGVKREAETLFRGQAERFLGEMDLVQREEFEAMREAALKAAEDAEALGKRVAALEARVSELEGTGKGRKTTTARRGRAETKTGTKASTKTGTKAGTKAAGN